MPKCITNPDGFHNIVFIYRVAVVFLVGVPQTKPQQKLLQEESDLYGDIIQGDVADTYVELPLKVGSLDMPIGRENLLLSSKSNL